MKNTRKARRREGDKCVLALDFSPDEFLGDNREQHAVVRTVRETEGLRGVSLNDAQRWRGDMPWMEFLKGGQIVCQWGSVVLALLAAFFWWRSAVVETPDPKSLDITVVTPQGPGPLGPIGASPVGVGQSQALSKLMLALDKQSKLSGVAALFAAAAALTQGIAMLPLGIS